MLIKHSVVPVIVPLQLSNPNGLMLPLVLKAHQAVILVVFSIGLQCLWGIAIPKAVTKTKCQQMPCDVIHRFFPASFWSKITKRCRSDKSCRKPLSFVVRERIVRKKTRKCKTPCFSERQHLRHTKKHKRYDVGSRNTTEALQVSIDQPSWGCEDVLIWRVKVDAQNLTAEARHKREVKSISRETWGKVLCEVGKRAELCHSRKGRFF